MKFTALDKRIWIKGLTLECPLGIALPDCPLNTLRHLPAMQMNTTINNLEDKQVEAIVHIHQYCYQERLKELAKAGTETGSM